VSQQTIILCFDNGSKDSALCDSRLPPHAPHDQRFALA
jgi:hypothetical protein